ncbi:hypothetical protein KBC54_02800 [Patescibacteria group bacterium]|nr:hypothetical protein [Patescibacteria group bacterium]
MLIEEKAKQSTPRRVEWIYLVYLLFFLLAVMSPSIVGSDHFGIEQSSLEEILIFLFGLAGLCTFAVYERLIERRMQERDVALGHAEKAKAELIESYQYIGSVNRQIEVLKTLVNKTSISLVDTDTYWKDILQSLAANTAASVNATSVLIRFLDLDKLRTEREIFHTIGKEKQLRMSNKELRKLHDFGSSHAFLRTEDGQEVLVVPSDRKESAMKAYFILTTDPSKTTDQDVSLAKVFANQAELVYHSLMRRVKDDDGGPLDQIVNLTSQVKGEVS